jgi:accessory gene regulator protein AgrB
MLKQWIDQFAHTLSSTDVKNHIQMLVIEPFLQYILKRSFPYMIIAICLFAGIFLFVVLTFVVLLMNCNKSSTTCVGNICQYCDKSF